MDNQLKQFNQECHANIQKSAQWFRDNLQADGNLGKSSDNLLAIYTVPYLYASVGLREEAFRSLNCILDRFSTHDGGFKRHISDSNSTAMSEQLPKVMSWLGVAAHQIGRFEISYSLSRYVRSYYDPEQGAFTAIAPYGQVEAVLDLFSTTMLGWFSLTMGDIKKAQRAGNFLQRVISLQTTKDQVFYLRVEQDGKLITNCAEEYESYYWVTSQKSKHNLHYLSMAVIFLAKLFHATKEESYLRCAQAYLETINSYSEVSNPFTAWGAAALANITREQRYIDKAQEILSQLIEQPIDDSVRTIVLSESLIELSML